MTDINNQADGDEVAQDKDIRRILRVMREHKIGVRPLRGGWWPDTNSASFTPPQLRTLCTALAEAEPFDDPIEAVRAVSSALGLANFP